ncbi:Golgi apparatus membrane protein TVP23 [Gloeopeniophorella convolvens]|nr:Golgi apparatus membrane protein TVP23 [Gloeopeniophorella convolvens]
MSSIEPDEPTRAPEHRSQPAVRALASTPAHAEAGLPGIFRQSAHPIALLALYLFRTAAIATYILCGFFTDNYVVSTVIVVVLLAMDFWNCRNVAGRTLVGLRFWNQVDDDGESYWIFESRDPSHPANPIDSRMFWTALYVFPALWLGLFVVSLLKFNLSFVPIVILALVFNVTNVIGFSYADRDAKKRWAQNVVSSNWSMGGLGGQMLTGVVKNSVGRVFGS